MTEIVPIGKSFNLLTKYYIGILTRKLAGIDIDRYFYAAYLLGYSKKSMCQKELADAMSVDTVTMVRIVDYLSKKGFISRVRSNTDRRFYNLILTEKAREALPQIKNAFKETEDECFSGFSEKEKRQFHQLLMRMHDNLHGVPKNIIKLNYKK